MKYLIMTVCVALIACDEGQLFTEENDFVPLGGNWLLFERGYSPGAGYVVDPVDPDPSQTLHFMPNRKVRSTIAELEKFSYYRIFEDPYQSGKIIAFYRDDPGDKATPESGVATYNVSSEDEATIRLDFRFCIEGCHIALRKIE
jgi:hypothetical protein